MTTSILAEARGTHGVQVSMAEMMRAAVAACVILVAGCATQAGSGAAVGTGIGALAGQLIGGDTEATLIGAAVGAGVGYLIGNERDKQSAAQMRAEGSHWGSRRHALGGSRRSPREGRVDFATKILEFHPDGRVVTTTRYRGGASHVDNESYRVAGDTLIVNKPGYIVNYRYAIDGGRMTLTAERIRATLRRI